MFGVKNKRQEKSDRYEVIRRMEDLNKLEHRYNFGKEDNTIAVSNQKFNYRYHDMKRQL